MNFEQLLSELKKKHYRPVYFLYGKEAYFIDAISNYVEQHVLNESEKAFNQTVLYGKETDHLTVVDCARRYPMMAAHQVVIIKEAQEMRTLDKLQSYIEKPLDSTILVICHKHKRINLNTKFGKVLKKNALVFESKPLYDNRIPDWIRTYLSSKNLKIKPGAATLIAEYLGTDLSKVANELDKLAINLPPGAEINEKQVEEQIGISKDYNVFELQKAIGTKDVLKASRIVQNFAADPRKNPMVVVISSLYNYFSKIYMMHFLRNATDTQLVTALDLRSSYFLREYKAAFRNFTHHKSEEVITLLKEYDLKVKGVDYNNTGKEEGELLKEMVWRIMH